MALLTGGSITLSTKGMVVRKLWPSFHCILSFKTSQELGVVVHTCNSNPGSRGRRQKDVEFEASLGYGPSPSLK
jgi:hypothetical protein